MSLGTLLGLVAGPALGVYVSKQIMKQEDTVYDALNKTVATNAGLAVLGLIGQEYLGAGLGHDAATGAMIGCGASAGVALGSRLITPETTGNTKLGGAATMKGLPPVGMSAMAGHPGAYARVPR